MSNTQIDVLTAAYQMTLILSNMKKVAISLLPTVVGCLHRCCGDNETADNSETDHKKQK